METAYGHGKDPGKQDTIPLELKCPWEVANRLVNQYEK
jgi:hypothetical protein